MSTGMIGADPRVLREMAASFDGAADTLMGVKGSVQSWVDRGDIWRGLDNRQFADGWDTTDSRAVANAATILRRYADILRANAEAQDSTSSEDGGRAGVTGSGLFHGGAGEVANGQVAMRDVTAEITRRLNEIDDVLKWTGDLFDAAGGIKFFAKLNPALAGFQGGWNVVDDLAHNDGRRFFEHSSAAGLGVVGGMVGAKAGAALFGAAGTFVLGPGVGTAIGMVVGGTLGSVAGTAVGSGVGAELGSAMDHAWRGEGPQYLEQKVDDIGNGLLNQAKIMTTPLAAPFAF